MTGSSFTSVTTRISKLSGAPDDAAQSSINMMMVSVRLEELEQQRQSLKKQCESLGLALTAVQNNPPKNLTEQQSREIISHQNEWETELNKLQKDLVKIDRNLTEITDVNEDLQSRFRSSLEKNLAVVQSIKNQKIDLLLKEFNTENPDVKYIISKTLNSAELQALYFKQVSKPQSVSLTTRLKNIFKREK